MLCIYRITMKFKILLFLLLLFTTLTAFSQRKKERVERLKIEGQKLYNNRNYSGAISCLSKALLISPSDRDLYVERAKNFYNLEKFDSTITDCNSVINLTHKCGSVCLYAKSLKATAFRELNLIDSAKALYLEVLNVQPNDFYTLMSFGEFYVKVNNYDSSMYYFNKSHKVNSSNQNDFIRSVLKIQKEPGIENYEQYD
jgi:tetratricopeptide (TPR) repeat protein